MPIDVTAIAPGTLYTLVEAARLVGRHPETLRRAIASGWLAVHKRPDKRPLIWGSALLAYLGVKEPPELPGPTPEEQRKRAEAAIERMRKNHKVKVQSPTRRR